MAFDRKHLSNSTHSFAVSGADLDHVSVGHVHHMSPVTYPEAKLLTDLAAPNLRLSRAQKFMHELWLRCDWLAAKLTV
jgi:hypothetical protein